MRILVDTPGERYPGIEHRLSDLRRCRNNLTIFTTDADFAHFAKVLPIALYGAD
jgi:hypothetical protein